ALVGRQREVIVVTGYTAAVGDLLLGLHQSNADPRGSIFYEVAIQAQFCTVYMAYSIVFGGVAYAHIVIDVRVEVPHVFVIGLHGELERTVIHSEVVVGTQYRLAGFLRPQVLMHTAAEVAHLAVEGWLRIDACG